jgi:TolB-like protein/Tfp pilus assembly protein PilF
MSFFEELKRRNVFRVGIAYVIVAWLLLQVTDLVLENINAPDWVMQVFMLAIAIGFPLALIIAWAFELTPEGIKRESEVDRNQSITPKSGHRLDRAIIVVLALAVVFLLYQQFAQKGPELPAETTPVVVEQEPIEEAAPTVTQSADYSIAVLPFVNMSPDPDNEYFSDGITEEILNRLAKIRQLQVTARTSVFSFKGEDRDVREIGSLLGVSNILEGSVRRDGEQVRITAQLIRSSDGFHLWSETYDRKLESIFAVQDEIAGEIAKAMELSLGVAASEGKSRSGPIDPRVYEYYLRARELHRKRTELARAIDLFQQALEIDPDFAPAWAGLAHAYSVAEFYVSSEQLAEYGDQHALSLAAAEKALELEPDLPSALHAIGNYHLTRFDWAKAQRFYESALEADPDSTDIMEDYSGMLMYSLQFEASRDIMERMLQLDPYVPLFQHAAAALYHMQGDIELRDQRIDQLIELAPDSWFAGGWILQRSLETGDLDTVHQQLDRINPQPWASRDDLRAAADWLRATDQKPSPAVLRVQSFWKPLAIEAGRYDIFFQSTLAEPPNIMLSEATQLYSPSVSPDELRRFRTHPGARELINTLRLPEYWDIVGWPDICRRVGKDDFECF